MNTDSPLLNINWAKELDAIRKREKSEDRKTLIEISQETGIELWKIRGLSMATISQPNYRDGIKLLNYLRGESLPVDVDWQEVATKINTGVNPSVLNKMLKDRTYTPRFRSGIKALLWLEKLKE